MRRTRHLATACCVASAVVLAGCAADPEAAPKPTETSSAPVDAGTDPGTELDFGEPATLVWQPSADVTGEVELSVDTVDEQSQSVFDGWARDDSMAASRPYFVTVTMTNTGDADLGGMQVPVYLRDDNGTLGAPWTLGGDFTACQSGPFPEPFASGDETQMCLVYLVPGGARIQDMVFEPTDGYDPISWTGDVGTPPRPTPRTSRKAGKRG